MYVLLKVMNMKWNLSIPLSNKGNSCKSNTFSSVQEETKARFRLPYYICFFGMFFQRKYLNEGCDETACTLQIQELI